MIVPKEKDKFLTDLLLVLTDDSNNKIEFIGAQTNYMSVYSRSIRKNSKSRLFIDAIGPIK